MTQSMQIIIGQFKLSVLAVCVININLANEYLLKHLY